MRRTRARDRFPISSSSSAPSGIFPGLIEQEVEDEGLEQETQQANGANSEGNASPAAAVQSPSRRNIADAQKLNEAIRAATILRNKLSEVSAKDMEDEAIKRQKSLSLIRAYQAVDTELDVLMEQDVYSLEVIEDRRAENIKSRNEEKGTTNDDLWKAFMSSAVENHRISQTGALQNMAITQIDLPNTRNPLDQGAWYECSNKSLVNVLVQKDSTIKATKNGSEISKQLATLQQVLRTVEDPTKLDEIFEDYRFKLQGKNEPEDALGEFKQFITRCQATTTIKRLYASVMKEVNQEPDTLFTLIAMLRSTNKANLLVLGNMQYIYPALGKPVKRGYQAGDPTDGNQKSANKKSRTGEPSPVPTSSKAASTSTRCNGCGGIHSGTCSLVGHPLYNATEKPWEESEVGIAAKAYTGDLKPTYNTKEGKPKVNYSVGWSKSKGFYMLSAEDKAKWGDKIKSSLSSSSTKGELIKTLLGILDEEEKEEELTPSPSPLKIPTVTYRAKVKEGLETQQGAHFTSCTICAEGGEVTSKFLPDTGSISSISSSGSYISELLFNKLKKELNIKTFEDGEGSKIKLPTLLSKTIEVKKHVYLHVEYKSRTEDRQMRATIKAYIIPDLAVEMIIGKNDLLGNCWIESKHLHGYDPHIIKAVEKDSDIKKFILDTYGTYPTEGFSPEETLARKRGEASDQRNSAMLLAIATMIDNQDEYYREFSLGTTEDRMRDESIEYFQDDPEEEYNEGELPKDVDGSPNFVENANKMNGEYRNMFSKKLAKLPARLPPFKFDIDVEKWMGGKEVRGVRPQSQPKQKAIKDYITEGFETLLEISEARRTSQVNMVPKPTPGEWRLTCDFRELNDCCKKMSFPLPKIEEIMGRIAKSGSRYFAKIDLTQGFHQVPLHIDHRIYSAFRTFMGTYQYLRMPMGTKGAPQYFQRCMTQVLEGLEDKCQAYIDDIFVHAKTEAELLENIKAVYDRLIKVGLTANPRKTSMGMRTLDYLGYTITREGSLLVNEKKRKELFEYPKPVYKKQMKSFIGLANVVQQRIPGCATLMKPLNAMLGAYTRAAANEKLIWTEDAESSFSKVKDLVAELPTLRLMKDGLRTVLRTDASDYGVGGHLVQIETLLDKDGVEYEEEYTIMFVSKAFDKTQLGWCTSEKECWATWYSCKKLQYLLEGIEFEVEVDHKNLTILRDSENDKVRRWKNFLQRFDIVKWRYIKGETNTVADALSRIVDIPEESHNQIMGMEFLGFLIEEVMNEEVTQSDEEDNDVSRANPGKEDSILFNLEEERNLHIDADHKKVLYKILDKVHCATEGHLGVAKTLVLVQNYLKECPPEELEGVGIIPYRTISYVVKKFIQTCYICQKQNEALEKLYIEPFVGSTYAPMERIQIDHVGPLPEDAYGNKHILVIVDTFTRWVEMYPVKDVSSYTTAWELCDYIFRYGPPREVHSDHGAAFIEQTYNDIANITGMKVVHPRPGDKERTAIVERENKEVRRHLNAIMNELFMNDRWSFAIKIVQRILNNTVHTSTGYAPAKLMFGKAINSIKDSWKDASKNKDFKDYSLWLKEKIDSQEKIIKYMKEKMIYQDQINMKKRNVQDRDILYAQDYVLYRNLDKTKTQLKYVGPYLITNRDGDFYELTSLTKEKKPFYAHARNLKRYHLREGVDPVEVALMDKNEYLLESIVDFKCTGEDLKDKNKYIFAVIFKGFPDDRHWLKYSEVENEEVFLKWCYGRHRPYTIGWISAKAKLVHAELIDELNSQESARIQKEKELKSKEEIEKAKETLVTEKPKSSRRKRTGKKIL